MATTKKQQDWRKVLMTRIRALIKEADPEARMEMKYKMPSKPKGVPVWYHDKMLCIGETYTHHLRITFPKGKLLKDPKKLLRYNALIIREGERLNEAAFKNLIREAVKFNEAAKAKPKVRAKKNQGLKRLK